MRAIRDAPVCLRQKRNQGAIWGVAATILITIFNICVLEVGLIKNDAPSSLRDSPPSPSSLHYNFLALRLWSTLQWSWRKWWSLIVFPIVFNFRHFEKKIQSVYWMQILIKVSLTFNISCLNGCDAKWNIQIFALVMHRFRLSIHFDCTHHSIATLLHDYNQNADSDAVSLISRHFATSCLKHFWWKVSVEISSSSYSAAYKGDYSFKVFNQIENCH